MFIWIIVTCSLYQITNANHATQKDKDPLLASLKAVEKAAEAVVPKLELSKAKKPVLLHTYPKINLEDVIKETKLRKILQLIIDNNKITLQDVNDKSRGPRIFVIKENVSDDYDQASDESKTKFIRENEEGNSDLVKHLSRRHPDLDISSDTFEDRPNAMDVTHLGLFNEPRVTRGKERSNENDEDEYTTKRKVRFNTVDRDWKEPRPLRQIFPKYTDGPFNDRNEDETIPRKRITPMGPYVREKPRGILYNYSEERWDSNVQHVKDQEKRDESVEIPNKPHRSYGYNRYQGKNQLLGRTPIPYAGNINIYEK